MIDRDSIERLYASCNRRDCVSPDPVELLYVYDDPADREIAALIASALAYGRVAQIVRSASSILRLMPKPAALLRTTAPRTLNGLLAGFHHRFTTGDQVAALLLGAKRAIERHGSLNNCFCRGLKPEHDTVIPALATFVAELTAGASGLRKFLLPSPDDGSACKRLNLFLRWLVRNDAVDPGGWTGVPATMLVIPLDTHMHRICRALRLTRRKQANLRTAIEVTAGFRAIAPEDPVRYDFALAHLGIRTGGDLRGALKGLRSRQRPA